MVRIHTIANARRVSEERTAKLSVCYYGIQDNKMRSFLYDSQYGFVLLDHVLLSF